jgi:predicted transcriptional regulator
MAATMVGEKAYPLRIPPDLYERVRALAEKHDRSANWVMVRLIEHALAQPANWVEDALRR